MKFFDQGRIGRVITINLGRGEFVLESVQEVLKQTKIKNAVLISGIGTTSRTVFHRVLTDADLPQEEFLTIEGATEISSIQGLVIDGIPHFHFVFSTPEKTYSGHLEPGCITLYLMELMLVEILDYNLTRWKDECGIAHLTENREPGK